MTFLPCNIWGGPLWKIWKITNGWGSGAAQRFDVLVPGWSELASVLAKKLKNCLSMQSQRDYRESATIYVVYSGGQKSSESDRQTEQWAVWYNLLHLRPRRLENKRRAYLTRVWQDRQGGWRDLTLCHVWKKKHSFYVYGFDVLSRSVLPWSINN